MKTVIFVLLAIAIVLLIVGCTALDSKPAEPKEPKYAVLFSGGQVVLKLTVTDYIRTNNGTTLTLADGHKLFWRGEVLISDTYIEVTGLPEVSIMGG